MASVASSVFREVLCCYRKVDPPVVSFLPPVYGTIAVLYVVVADAKHSRPFSSNKFADSQGHARCFPVGQRFKPIFLWAPTFAKSWEHCLLVLQSVLIP